MSQADNACRWDGSQSGHYEVWYLTCNHRPSSTGFWIRYTLEAPLSQAPYAQLWFAFFDADHPERHFGIHRSFPIAKLSTNAEPFSVTVGDSTLSHEHARGQLAGAGHEVAWDLSWAPSPTTHRHLPRTMYRRGGLGETTVLAPNLDLALSGTITVDGQVFTLDREPGGQTHLWGRKHAHAWAWGHCNGFRTRAGQPRPGACLEALSVDLVRAGISLPRLTLLTLYLDHKQYRFTGFRHLLRTRAEYDVGRFSLRATGIRHRIDACFSCRPQDMILTPYVDPDGDPSFCANSEIANLRVIVYERDSPLAPWREKDCLVAPHTAHFEIGRRDQPDIELPRHVAVEDGAGSHPASE